MMNISSEDVRIALQEHKFLEQLRDSIRHQNAEVFKKCLGKKVEEIFNKEKFGGLEFTYGGIHYISPSLGEWFRFNFGDVPKLDSFTDPWVERLYLTMPKEYNLPTWDRLLGSVKVWFQTAEGGDPGLSEEELKQLLKVKPNDTKSLCNLVTSGELFKFMEGQQVLNLDAFDVLLNDFWQKLKILGPNAIMDPKMALILLTFSHIYTLYKLSGEFKTPSTTVEAESKKENPPNGLYSLIVPQRAKFLDITDTERIFNLGGFGGIFSKPQSNESIEKIEAVVNDFFGCLANLEMSIPVSARVGNNVIAEDVIRTCSALDRHKEKILNAAGRYVGFIDKIMTEHLAEYEIEVEGEVKESKDEMIKYLKEYFTGSSDLLIQILERIIVTLKQQYDSDFIKDDEVVGHCSTLFLFGEEGVGKDIIAKICHLVNPRSYHRSYVPRVLHWCLTTYESEGQDDYKLVLDMARIKSSAVSSYIVNQQWEEARKNLGNNPFFNLRDVNAATLDEKTFPKVIFGERVKEKVVKFGEVEVASVLGGSLFFDEVDKLKPRLANQLLRVLERPYVFQRVGEVNRRFCNLLIIFASNKRIQDFSHDEFSSAFKYRIGRNYFEIPPLRSRCEDIAIFVANEIIKRNEKVAEVQEGEEIKSIDLNGLRLICELPWLNNYRGLQSFISTLFMERNIRRITSDIISYDEILRVLRRLQLLTE